MIGANFANKTVKAAIFAVAATLLAACETTPDARSVDIDTASVSGADFSNYQTYFVLDVPPGENDAAPPKPFSRVVVEAAVRRELDARNYREIDNKDAADMLVAIQFSLQDEIQYKERTTYETEIVNYGGGYGRGYGRGYGSRGYNRSGYNRGGYSYGYGYRDYYGYRTVPRSTVVAENFRQGNMLIDLIDRESHSAVWVAHASGEGEHKLDRIEAKVNAVVASMFSRYPHVAAPAN